MTSGTQHAWDAHDAARVASIRSQLGHPVIDNDGHIIEYLPLVRDILVDLAGEDVATRFDRVVQSGRLVQSIDPSARRALGLSRNPWWGIPAANTNDRATAMLPALLHGRLDEIGIDVAFLYPTYGLIPIHLADAELRRALCRAFNIYAAEVHAPFGDRLIPVAAIPTFEPQEAVDELEFAVGTLGLRAVMLGGAVPRSTPTTDGGCVKWMDGLGHGSMYDYTPVWSACDRLGVVPTFHSSGTGWGARTSPTNYVFNHIGNFAVAGELAARSLFFGGVPMRFPNLRFAFLEGGVAWACNLFADILAHHAKRRPGAIEHYDPARLNRAVLAQQFERFALGRVRERRHRLGEALSLLSDEPSALDPFDEFAEALIGGDTDIARIFTEQFFFGCEADDPLTSLAFDPRYVPGGGRMRAVFASDIGHWDVPDICGVLAEAYEAVEDERMSAESFRDLTFANPARLWSGAPFRGTIVADAVRSELGADD